MNEKILKGIEFGASAALSIGADFVITKAVTNLVKPETVPEKILTAIGTLGVELAVDYGIASIVHSALYPSDNCKYEKLAAETEEGFKVVGEFDQMVVDRYIKLDNKVDDLVKQMQNMGKTGGNS